MIKERLGKRQELKVTRVDYKDMRGEVQTYKRNLNKLGRTKLRTSSLRQDLDKIRTVNFPGRKFLRGENLEDTKIKTLKWV